MFDTAAGGRLHPIDRVALIVPARDEQRTVAGALESIGRAVAEVGAGREVHVTVVDDGSTDATRAIALRVLASLDLTGAVISIDRGCVGTARRIGVESATAGWRAPQRAWILSTDADSRVRPDWIVRHLDHADAGAQAVSGIVDIVGEDRRSPLRDRWWADYGAEIDRHHRHPYAHATNLGVRLDAYRRVGGFRDLERAEDADLWRRLRQGGIPMVADARIVVDTSDRRAGRVRTGFAHALATLYPDSPPVHAGDG